MPTRKVENIANLGRRKILRISFLTPKRETRHTEKSPTEHLERTRDSLSYFGDRCFAQMYSNKGNEAVQIENYFIKPNENLWYIQLPSFPQDNVLEERKKRIIENNLIILTDIKEEIKNTNYQGVIISIPLSSQNTLPRRDLLLKFDETQNRKVYTKEVFENLPKKSFTSDSLQKAYDFLTWVSWAKHTPESSDTFPKDLPRTLVEKNTLTALERIAENINPPKLLDYLSRWEKYEEAAGLSEYDAKRIWDITEFIKDIFQIEDTI
jgi:hypothetical protein